MTHFNPFHPIACGLDIDGIKMRFHVDASELQYKDATPEFCPTATQMTPFHATSCPVKVEETVVTQLDPPSVLVETPPTPTATHFPPPHAIPFIAEGTPVAAALVHVVLSVDVMMDDAVVDPAIHFPPPHAIDSAPPAVDALADNVQLMLSPEVITPNAVAAAQTVPFHAMARIGTEPLVNPDVDATVHVDVGSDAY
jgi:hypothetical protein